jgi:hypothetical protein
MLLPRITPFVELSVICEPVTVVALLAVIVVVAPICVPEAVVVLDVKDSPVKLVLAADCTENPLVVLVESKLVIITPFALAETVDANPV